MKKIYLIFFLIFSLTFLSHSKFPHLRSEPLLECRGPLFDAWQSRDTLCFPLHVHIVHTVSSASSTSPQLQMHTKLSSFLVIVSLLGTAFAAPGSDSLQIPQHQGSKSPIGKEHKRQRSGSELAALSSHVAETRLRWISKLPPLSVILIPMRSD